MDRHFLVPATIAAALHAGLLLGIRPDAAELPKSPVKPTTIVTPFVMPPDAPPPIEENEREAVHCNGAPPRPALDEPPPMDRPSPFVVQVDRGRINITHLHVDKIPMTPGVPGGPGDRPGFDGGKILSHGDLENTPRARVTAAPAYPFEARRNGQTGEVVVEFVVDEAGNVHTPTVARSSDRVFEEAALRAVARWKFEPGKRDGKAVRFRMALPIQFTLNGE
jgi:protein TonB